MCCVCLFRIVTFVQMICEASQQRATLYASVTWAYTSLSWFTRQWRDFLPVTLNREITPQRCTYTFQHYPRSGSVLVLASCCMFSSASYSVYQISFCLVSLSLAPWQSFQFAWARYCIIQIKSIHRSTIYISHHTWCTNAICHPYANSTAEYMCECPYFELNMGPYCTL